jgi:hypothetical protein
MAHISETPIDKARFFMVLSKKAVVISRAQQVFFGIERLELVFRPVFKTGSGRITPSVAGSIPAPSVFPDFVHRAC